LAPRDLRIEVTKKKKPVFALLTSPFFMYKNSSKLRWIEIPRLLVALAPRDLRIEVTKKKKPVFALLTMYFIFETLSKQVCNVPNKEFNHFVVRFFILSGQGDYSSLRSS